MFGKGAAKQLQTPVGSTDAVSDDKVGIPYKADWAVKAVMNPTVTLSTAERNKVK